MKLNAFKIRFLFLQFAKRIGRENRKREWEERIGRDIPQRKETKVYSINSKTLYIIWVVKFFITSGVQFSEERRSKTP
jgi:hypothetical protein